MCVLGFLDWMPAVIAVAGIVLSFWDGHIIDRKVENEIGARVRTLIGASLSGQTPASKEDGDDRTAQIVEDVALISGGTATVMAFLWGMVAAFANGLLAVRAFGDRFGNWPAGMAVLLGIVLLAQIAHLFGRARLSDVEDLKILWRFSLGHLLRIELIVVNTVVLGGLAYAIALAHGKCS